MATIRKLKSGNWNVQIRLKGKLLATKTFKSNRLAQNWAQQKENESINKHPLFIDAGESYCHIVLAGKPTQKPTHKCVERISQHPKLEQTMDKITLQDVNAFKQTRLAEVKPSTCRDELLFIRRVYRWYIRELRAQTGEVLPNPCDLLTIPSASKPRDRVVTRAELQLLLGAMTTAMAIVTEIAYETAMRRSEILKLTPNDLHLNSRYLRVVNGKEGSRDVPLTRRAVELLETSLESLGQRTRPLFPFAPFSVSQAFRRARIRVGLDDDVRFHQLRHTRISIVARKGFSQAQIMLVSGHRDIRSVQRYTHLNVRDVIDLLD